MASRQGIPSCLACNLDSTYARDGADAAEGEEAFTSTGFFLSVLGGGDAETSQRWFDALSEGGMVLDPLQKRAWGDFDGQVRDRFGVTWLIGYEPAAS